MKTNNNLQDEILYLTQKITQKYDEMEDSRRGQINDINLIKNAIYNSSIPAINEWNTKIQLPEIYELAQTLKAHISENLFAHPDSMFDVSSNNPQAQLLANRQKAMLVNTFEQMKIEEEMEKIIDSIVETGESTIFVGWQTKTKVIRRPQTIEEQLTNPSESGFVIEENVIYDNAKVKFIKPEDFVFDKNNMENWDSCAKVYRIYSTIHEIISDKSNNLLTEEKIKNLKDLISNKKSKNSTADKAIDGNKCEILEYWGDIELQNGEILKNQIIVVAGRHEIIRMEDNPFVINPFIYANIIKNPETERGISPLKVALILNNISSTILNKQIDALSLMMNPPYLAPKGCFKGEQIVRPGKIIEYDSALMPQAPTPLNFDNALHGWDFLNYFKNTTESATGIFKNMAGNLQNEARTATELTYSVTGQTARLNMMLDAINRKLIIPMVEKTAEIISNFKLGRELICINEHGKTMFMEIDDTVRNANYIYRYGDRKATLERKTRSKELFDVVKSFAEVPSVNSQINWIECFKFALEQYGIENANHFLLTENMPAENNMPNA
ncbi:MAG: hypothetical protein ACI4SM_04715 [Candidatus Gastranaerophilaceae bacterium]